MAMFNPMLGPLGALFQMPYGQMFSGGQLPHGQMFSPYMPMDYNAFAMAPVQPYTGPYTDFASTQPVGSPYDNSIFDIAGVGPGGETVPQSPYEGIPVTQDQAQQYSLPDSTRRKLEERQRQQEAARRGSL